MQVTPIIIENIPTAVRGIELMMKYDIGAKIAPARLSPNPSIRYGFVKILTPK